MGPWVSTQIWDDPIERLNIWKCIRTHTHTNGLKSADRAHRYKCISYALCWSAPMHHNAVRSHGSLQFAVFTSPVSSAIINDLTVHYCRSASFRHVAVRPSLFVLLRNSLGRLIGYNCLVYELVWLYFCVDLTISLKLIVGDSKFMLVKEYLRTFSITYDRETRLSTFRDMNFYPVSRWDEYLGREKTIGIQSMLENHSWICVFSIISV